MTLLVTDPGFDADIVARKITETEGVLCAAPEYTERFGAPEQPTELALHSCLKLKHQLVGGSGDVWRLDHRKSGETATITVSAALVSNHLDVLLRAALDGAGIAVLPSQLAAPYLLRGELVRVLPGWSSGRLLIYAALPSRKFLPARTRVFLDFLLDKTRIALAELEDQSQGEAGVAAD